MTTQPFGCARCGHPYALHSNGKSACRATGCSVPPADEPCEGFQWPSTDAEPHDEPQAATG